MKAYLVQHGQAKSKEDDPDRPLTAAGAAAVDEVGGLLARSEALAGARVVHSGKTRARQTAERLAGALGLGPPGEDSGLAPLDDPAGWAERLGRHQGDVVLVGHLPHLSRLAGLLVTGDPDRAPVRFVNAGVVCLLHEGEHWSIAWAVAPELVA